MNDHSAHWFVRIHSGNQDLGNVFPSFPQRLKAMALPSFSRSLDTNVYSTDLSIAFKHRRLFKFLWGCFSGRCWAALKMILNVGEHLAIMVGLSLGFGPSVYEDQKCEILFIAGNTFAQYELCWWTDLKCMSHVTTGRLLDPPMLLPSLSLFTKVVST